jgi:hypothetical protein
MMMRRRSRSMRRSGRSLRKRRKKVKRRGRRLLYGRLAKDEIRELGVLGLVTVDEVRGRPPATRLSRQEPVLRRKRKVCHDLDLDPFPTGRSVQRHNGAKSILDSFFPL